MNLNKFFQIILLSFVSTFFVGCATTLAPPSRSGFYNPPAQPNNYSVASHGQYGATFNGAPVAENQPTMIAVVDQYDNVLGYVSSGADPKVQRMWAEQLRKDKKLDYQMDKGQWQMTEKSADNVMKRIDRGVRTGERLMKAIGRLGF